MFGTLGFSELIIILVIVLIIFGAGRLPQIGEGFGKALKGFKKAVHEEPPPVDPNAPQTQAPPSIEDAQVVAAQAAQAAPAQQTVPPAPAQGTPQSQAAPSKPTAPYIPGPEATPGTTAAMMAAAAPQAYQPPPPRPVAPVQAPATAARPVQGPMGYAPPPPVQSTPPHAAPPPPTMEQRMAQGAPMPRAQYPPLPPGAMAGAGKAPPKRPSAVVNKDAVARVQAKQAEMRAQAAQQNQGFTTQDMQGLGESLGDALRTFRQAAADVRGAVDPQLRTIQTEFDVAQKEIEQSIEAAKELPAVQDEPPKQA